MSNTVASYIAKVRTWGIKGVWDYFVAKIEERRLRNFFLKNAARHPLTPTNEGLTLVAPFHANSALCKVMRDFVFRLRDNGIPFQTFDTSKTNDIPDSEIDTLITPREDFRIMKYASVIELFCGPMPAKLGLKKSHVVFWEFESGFFETFPQLRSSDTIIAMSDFNAAYFRRTLPPSTPVAKILFPFRFTSPSLPPAEETRKRFGIGQDDFVVFFNFDYGSSFFRKNPDGAMRAFAKAFSQTPNTLLVFKTVRADEHKVEKARLDALAKELRIANRFRSFDEFMPHGDVYALTNACDVYISLHRGEGFGLGIAEAMSMGKPVLITGYGGPTEFCNETNALLVQYKTVAITAAQKDHPWYASASSCAEPDIDNAATALRRLHDSAELRQRLGDAGKAFIAEHFNDVSFTNSVRAFLGMGN